MILIKKIVTEKTNRLTKTSIDRSVLLRMAAGIGLTIPIPTCGRSELVCPKNRLQPTVDHPYLHHLFLKYVFMLLTIPLWKCLDYRVIESFSIWSVIRLLPRYCVISVENICMRCRILYELFFPTHTLESCKHVTFRFRNWWLPKHMTYFEDNRHHLVSGIIPPLS